MELLRDMLLLPVAGSLALLGGIAALIFGGVGVLLAIATTLGGPVMLLWGIMTIAAGDVLLGTTTAIAGILWWVLIAQLSENEVDGDTVTIE